MKNGYTTEKNIQIMISLMKAHGIHRVIASPGSTNISFVASLMYDGTFDIYSAPDERSAAYMACGMAAESGEPVALSCTGATASRNYIPGLTEAFYRKLPVLAITSTQHTGQIGQHVPQVIDRTTPLNDMVNLSVQIPIIYSKVDEWSVNTKINEALLELRHRGGGPVHVNLTTSYPLEPMELSVKALPISRVIRRIQAGDKYPSLKNKKIAIFIGNHRLFSDEELEKIELFCEKYDAVVLVDHTSNYHGRYMVSASLVTSQDMYKCDCTNIDILIHIGDVSGAYLSLNPKEVWRVNIDGKVRDTFKKLTYVFETEEALFFEEYCKLCDSQKSSTNYYHQWKDEYDFLYSKLPQIPFSNIWIAQNTYNRLPTGSYLHLGILNSLRTWNFMMVRNDIYGFSNTGGFGIDGILSSLVGASIEGKDSLHFLVVGDLAFFYDINVLGNRHIGSNIRIMLVNNGKGMEFKNYTNCASRFGDDSDKFIAAGGHYGNKSRDLVKHFAEDLGFKYISASDKEQYLKALPIWISPEVAEKPIIFEVFTGEEKENEALRIIRNAGTEGKYKAKQATKNIVKTVIGENGVSAIKKILD